MSRNAEALEAILRRRHVPREVAAELARVLPSDGVLAVDSLTDEQAIGLPDFVEVDDRTPYADAMRAALRRCATGEPTSGD